MNVFHCSNCRNLLFFENVECVACKHKLAYLPDREEIARLDPAGHDLWRPLPQAAGGLPYRLCANYSKENVCNWAVQAGDDNPSCQSCRLTSVIPDLSRPGHRDHWRRLETAKRRLIYTLLALGLPLTGKDETPRRGLTFQFLADPNAPGAPPASSPGTTTESSPSTLPRPMTRCARSDAIRCTKATARYWATSDTRSATTTGTG